MFNTEYDLYVHWAQLTASGEILFQNRMILLLSGQRQVLSVQCQPLVSKPVSISHDFVIRSCIITLKHFLHALLLVYNNSCRYSPPDSTISFHTPDHSIGITGYRFRQSVTLQFPQSSQTVPLFSTSILFNSQNSDSDYLKTILLYSKSFILPEEWLFFSFFFFFFG